MLATFNGFMVELNKTPKRSYGFPIYSYKVTLPESSVTFEGDSFKPSIAAIKNELLLPIELLQWVCLYYYENEDSLFDNHSASQLYFAMSDDCYTFAYVMDDAYENIENKCYAVLFSGTNTQIVKVVNIDVPLVIIKHLPE